MMKSSFYIIGYSGHSFVCLDVALKLGYCLKGYFDSNKKKINPFDLTYMGNETTNQNLQLIQKSSYFIGVGDNKTRHKITKIIVERTKQKPISLLHPSLNRGFATQISTDGVLVAAGVSINTYSNIEKGVICNTNCSIDHECQIGEYAHIAPGAVLAGNVSIGAHSFIGANSVVKQGVKIGKSVVIGAGTVVLKDVPDNVVMIGNPGKILRK
jgi:sugar O-acyltransferase (sialic acid O-acetyltransferase NeuD family)